VRKQSKGTIGFKPVYATKFSLRGNLAGQKTAPQQDFLGCVKK
jgi:hypothetical protein